MKAEEMKVINDLVVVEVPKGFHNPVTIRDGKSLQWVLIGRKGRLVDKLPFPCTIIGLASEIARKQMNEVLQSAKYDWLDMLSIEYKEFLTKNELTSTETTDLLFLKRN